MTHEHLTIGQATADGWEAVNDAGQPRHVPRTAAHGVRDLRVGQRVRAEMDGGRVRQVALP